MSRFVHSITVRSQLERILTLATSPTTAALSRFVHSITVRSQLERILTLAPSPTTAALSRFVHSITVRSQLERILTLATSPTTAALSRFVHRPDSECRTRIREHSSQRTTRSLGALRMTSSSAGSIVSWQPVQRPWCSAAAPTPRRFPRSFS